MKRIELQFNKAICKLAGNSYGIKTYEDQVKGKFDMAEGCVIVFPNQINRIASSFIQGFFYDMVVKMGISAIKERIRIESSIANLKDFILSSLI